MIHIRFSQVPNESPSSIYINIGRYIIHWFVLVHVPTRNEYQNVIVDLKEVFHEYACMQINTEMFTM